MKQFKIRCSAIGLITGSPRTKKAKEAGELSETAKSYCKMWLKEQLYNRKQNVKSKYLIKGIDVEADAIQYASDVLRWGMVFKNEQYKENDFITGTPDLIFTNKIVDIKSSYTWETFPFFENTPPDKSNDQQIQGYMDLFSKKYGQIVYVLMDTPDELIERDLYGVDDAKEADEIIRAHKYDDLPSDLRIKEFETKEFDQNFINFVYEQVEKCRKFINSLK